MPNTTPTTRVFLDSSALFSGVFSSRGASRALLMLAEAGVIQLCVSEQVIAETENALARKAPGALPFYRRTLKSTGLLILPDPAAPELDAYAGLIGDRTDVPILAAAARADVDYLASLDQHFAAVGESPDIDLPRIGTPREVLAWLRQEQDR